MAGGCGEQCEIQICNIRPKGTEVKLGLQHLSDREDNTFALVVERKFDKRNDLDTTTLRVNSPHLLRVFKDVVKQHPAVPADYDAPFEMESPFEMLFHYYDELHAHAEKDELEDVSRMHLRLLLGFMKAEIGPSKALVDSMVAAGSISYAALWTIFKPGQLVYTILDKHPWVLRLEKTAYEESRAIGKYLEVHCTYLDYDGQRAGEARSMIRIRQKQNFAAEHPAKITRLPVYPLEWADEEGLQKRLAERGAKFLTLSGIQIKAYDGLLRYLKEPPYDFYDPDMGEFPGVFLPDTVSSRPYETSLRWPGD
jgi:hypothetical protein